MSPSLLLRRAAVACLLLLLATVTPSLAQDPAAKTTRVIDHPGNLTPSGATAVVERFGSFLVGDTAPDVDLADTQGQRFHLDDARHAGPWLIVFARAAEDLDALQGARSDLAALGISTVAIGPFRRDAAPADPAAVRLLPDRANYTARTYGMFDPVTTNPRTGAFLVGKDGRLLLIVSGGLPSSEDLVRMSKKAMTPLQTAVK